MGNYKVYDGQGNWLDPCDHEIYFLDDQLGWQRIDPNTRDIRYHDGTYTNGWPTWKPMTCECLCPEGSTLNPLTGTCQSIESPTFPGTPQILTEISRNGVYNKFGIRLFSPIGLISSPSPGVITCPNYTLPLLYPSGTATVKDSALVSVPVLSQVQSDLWGRDISSGANDPNKPFGRMNNAGLAFAINATISFSSCVNINVQKEYILAISADNYVKLEIDLGATGSFSTLFNGFNTSSATISFNSLHAFPVTLPVGNHVIKLTANDAGGYAGTVAEIYNITLSDFQNTLLNGTNVESDLEPYIHFTSKSLRNISIAPPGTLPTDYVCASGTLDLCSGAPVCIVEVPCL